MQVNSPPVSRRPSIFCQQKQFKFEGTSPVLSGTQLSTPASTYLYIVMFYIIYAIDILAYPD